MKLSLKLNLLFALLVSGILFAMALIIYNVSRNNVQTEFNQRLRTRAGRTAYLYKALKDTTGLLKSLDEQSPAALLNKSVTIYDTAFRKIYEFHDAGTTALVPEESWLTTSKEEGGFFFTKKERKDVCVYYDNQQSPPFILVVAAENITGEKYINDLKKAFLLFFPVAVLVTLAIGYLFSRSIIKPVKETIHDVQLISSQNLSQRLYIGKRKDELGELNRTFNELLNRLEESFAIQRRFISNASHEFSTPLTSISSQIEVAQLQNRSSEEYKRVLDSVLEDVKDLQQLTKTLLEIAKAGTHGTISLDKIRIDEVILKAHSDVLKLDNSFTVALEFPDLPEDENEAMIFGNALLLQSACKNIMENGCKYSPDKTVHVQLLLHTDNIEILFSNKSDSISEEEISRLFEPFYRSGNSGGKSGVGLGLTLTRRIISLHKGSVTVQSHPDKGTVFRILLPNLRK
jgi:two-component system sensor histidine kinase ArlS